MAHVLILCKRKSGYGSSYDGGLVTNALHTVAVLTSMGVTAELVEVADPKAAMVAIAGRPLVTHAVLEGVWVTAGQAIQLAVANPTVQVAVRAHSKMGFLQVEPDAIASMRGILEVATPGHLRLSSNNQEFAGSFGEAYGAGVLYLPNLYDSAAAPQPSPIHDGVLRVGSFGASRLLKFHPSAALAALQVAQRLDVDLQFYHNVDSTPGGDSVRRSVRNVLQGLDWVQLTDIPWQPADEFRRTIATMDLVLQLSATETFCLVAADAVASGVPVVAGPAVGWLPPPQKVDVDDTSAVADAAVRVLQDRFKVARRQLQALGKFQEDAKDTWGRWLGLPRRKWLGIF